MTVVAAAVMAAISVWLLATPRATVRIQAITSSGSAQVRQRPFARVRRVVTSRRRDRRTSNGRHVVQVADLLASLLAAGLDATTSVRIVADSVPPPARATLTMVARAMQLGAPPEAAWQSVTDDPSWQPIGAAMARSARSGAPVAAVLADTAEELRQEQLRHIQVAARTAGVRSVGPLAACFLPGYLLLGVVPVVAGLAGRALQG